MKSIKLKLLILFYSISIVSLTTASIFDVLSTTNQIKENTFDSQGNFQSINNKDLSEINSSFVNRNNNQLFSRQEDQSVIKNLEDKTEKLEIEVNTLKLKMNSLIDLNKQMFESFESQKRESSHNINTLETKIEIIAPKDSEVKATTQKASNDDTLEIKKQESSANKEVKDQMNNMNHTIKQKNLNKRRKKSINKQKRIH